MEFKDSIVFERFKDPAGYLKNRRQTEQWVRETFMVKGGTPQEAYPISMVLGESVWLTQCAPDPARHGEIHIPLSAFEEGDISFTFPDSMVSRWLGIEKPEPYYLPAYHGQVFTRSEMLAIVRERGFPEETWDVQLPDNVGAYIEAQVWNHAVLMAYKPTVPHHSFPDNMPDSPTANSQRPD